MKYSLLLAAIILMPTYLFAQDCNCITHFDFLKKTIEENYSGFKDKVRDENKQAYLDFTDEFAQKAKSVTNEEQCFEILFAWKAWFKDGHIQLNIGNPPPEKIRAKFTDWPKIEFNESQFKNFLNQKEASQKDAHEGIYVSDDGNYQIGLVKSGKDEIDYEGFIIKADSLWWMPGQIKFELIKDDIGFKANYFMRNHSLKEVTCNIKDNVIYVEGLGNWNQTFPIKVEVFANQEKNEIYSIVAIDQNTLLLTIPTMNDTYAKDFKNLIKRNKSILKNSKNLIIDVRNNGGGSDMTYFKIRPYIYTQPYEWYHTQNFSTKENNNKYHELAKDKNYPLLYRWQFKRTGKKLDKKLGQMVGKKGPEKSRLWKKYKQPENIIVLLNAGCGSSCEQFVLFAQQSSKVTTMGVNSAGVLDYGNLHSVTFPEVTWVLNYPTTRKSAIDYGYGIDNIGISPDVLVDESITDWISFALDYLRNK